MLIVNPFATSTSDAGRDALANTLSSRFDLTVETTTHRGHAGELAARARDEQYSVVIVHGGDGTVNEVVNGLLGAPSARVSGNIAMPAIAVVPGGSANVFARALGMAPDPLRATGQLVELIEQRAQRRVSLAHTDDRWFLFNAGVGTDAAVIKSIEHQRNSGKKATPARYFATTLRCFFEAARRHPTVTVTVPGTEPMRAAYYAFVSNTSPWTYLGSRPVNTNPGTTFDTRLGVFASKSMSVWRNLPLAGQMLRAGADPRAGHILRADDVESVLIESDKPVDMQMDGEYLGLRTHLEFGYAPAVLDVVAPKTD